MVIVAVAVVLHVVSGTVDHVSGSHWCCSAIVLLIAPRSSSSLVDIVVIFYYRTSTPAKIPHRLTSSYILIKDQQDEK